VDGIVIVHDESNERVQAEILPAAQPPDPEKLPATFPLTIANKVLGVGRNQGYAMVRAGTYPVRVLEINGRYKVSRYDLLAYLGASRGAA
jgi:hypothetical protein